MTSLPAFLKLLTSKQTLTMHQAVVAAQKLYPSHASIDLLKAMNHSDLKEIGIQDEKIRDGVIALCQKVSSPNNKRKRGRDSDLDQPLPSKRKNAETVQQTFDFEEIDHEETLNLKSCVVNRAPMMEAWATVVAERLGFRRREALSIAQVYTDMNANASGVARGIYPSSSKREDANGNQPYVDLMGRRIPVLEMQDGEWRAISKGEVVEPTVAFGYLKRSFAQQLGAVIGSLRLLAETFAPNELNQKGYGLYLDFRPDSEGWGKKAEVRMTTILDLRRYLTHKDDVDVKKEEQDTKPVISTGQGSGSPSPKKDSEPEKDEFDAQLDDDLDLSALNA